jgi:hypothetical protein
MLKTLGAVHQVGATLHSKATTTARNTPPCPVLTGGPGLHCSRSELFLRSALLTRVPALIAEGAEHEEALGALGAVVGILQ